MEQRLSAAPGKVAADLPDVGLSAGLGCKADCIASGSAVAGTLTATVDPSNRVTESNESNT